MDKESLVEMDINEPIKKTSTIHKVLGFLKKYRKSSKEKQLLELLQDFLCPNLRIINSPVIFHDGLKMASTINDSLLKVINENKDKTIYLYLSGSDIKSNKIRAIIV